MSHHLDSVTAQRDGRLNLLDLYAFGGAADTSVLVLTVCPDAQKTSPAELHPQAAYDINVDSDGDLIEDFRFRIIAEPADGLGRQQVRVISQTGRHLPAPAETAREEGELIGAGAFGDPFTLAQRGRGWIGLAADPFAADGLAFNSVTAALADGKRPDLTEFGRGGNLFAGRNVVAIVLQVANTMLSAPATPTSTPPQLGLWATVTVHAGVESKQVSRWGRPHATQLLTRTPQEVEEMNAGHPGTDLAEWTDRATARLAQVSQLTAGPSGPDHASGPITAFLPQLLPYTPRRAARFDLADGNGRQLHDDAFDLVLSAYLGRPINDSITPAAASQRFPHLRPATHNDLPAFIAR